MLVAILKFKLGDVTIKPMNVKVKSFISIINHSKTYKRTKAAATNIVFMKKGADGSN